MRTFEKIPKKCTKKGEYLSGKPFKVKRYCIVCKKIFEPSFAGNFYCTKCKKVDK